MTPTERNDARQIAARHGGLLGGTTLLLQNALTNALDALDQRDALLRDVRDHVQQCCGCLTYGDWLDKIGAALGDAG